MHNQFHPIPGLDHLADLDALGHHPVLDRVHLVHRVLGAVEVHRRDLRADAKALAKLLKTGQRDDGDELAEAGDRLGDLRIRDPVCVVAQQGHQLGGCQEVVGFEPRTDFIGKAYSKFFNFSMRR